MLLEFEDGFAGERMPVAHGHNDTRVESAAQFAFQRGGLPQGKFENRRAATDFRIMAAYVACARPGNQTRQGPPRDGGQGEIDDIRVAEEVVEKGLDGVDGIRATQLKQYDANPAA